MGTKKMTTEAEETKESADEHEGHVHGHNCNHGHTHDALKPIIRVGAKIGRNDPCTCGSNKKYKKCCGV
jgi:SEC-C motif-containing protein